MRRIRDLIIPQYDEVALFSMSFTFILIVATGIFSASEELNFAAILDFRTVFLILILLSGPILSIYHAFTDRPKTSFEKYFMLMFAVIVNGFSGIYAGAYALEKSNNWLAVFPILNITNGALLLMMLREGVLTESSISDQNASHGQILIAAIAIIILFSLCHYAFSLIWIQTFSICVAYSTNLSRGLPAVFFQFMKKSTL